MSDGSGSDLSGFSMLDLFRQEAEAQVVVLNEGLIALERNPRDQERLEALMRAAHSLKGAARIVGLDTAVHVAHALEDCFVAAQQGQIVIQPAQTDVLLSGVDILSKISRLAETELAAWTAQHQAEMDVLLARLAAVKSAAPQPPQASAPPTQPSTPPSTPPAAAPQPTPPIPIPSASAPSAPPETADKSGPAPHTTAETGDRTVRVSSDNLNRLLGMAGEMLVQTHWFEPFLGGLLNLKKRQTELSRLLRHLVALREAGEGLENLLPRLLEAQTKAAECGQLTAEHLKEMDLFSRRTSDLTERLYREAVASRMRPFSDGVQGFPRMVRDLARQLNKQVRFEVAGQSTGVDREILERLEAPLTHLLRNALDHGLETPAQREAAGKPPEGFLKLEAWHHAGLLHLSVSDDGRGIDPERLRERIVTKGLSSAEMAARLSEAELLDFIFLPGFSTSERVTEISGRGVGMDIVHKLAQDVGGSVRIENRPGQGATFHLQLPITLSVLRALLVEIAGEPCALPLTRIDRLLTATADQIQTLEGRRYVSVDDRNIGLVDARDVLEIASPAAPSSEWSIVVVGDQSIAYGLMVDRFLGECKLVVRPLDARLGKVPNVSAASLLDDGTPVLILDVEDLIRSIHALLSGGRLRQVRDAARAPDQKPRKRILVADDSLTVREIERKLLENHGYEVEVAVDGMEAWNLVRMGAYDLVVSDIDMPRMNGFDLVSHIKREARLNAVPVVIVSYKDREEDRRRGLEAGANYYLTKSSFHDESFVKAVVDLIGEP